METSRLLAISRGGVRQLDGEHRANNSANAQTLASQGPHSHVTSASARDLLQYLGPGRDTAKEIEHNAATERPTSHWTVPVAASL